MLNCLLGCLTDLTISQFARLTYRNVENSFCFMCKMHQDEQMTNELFTEISSEISSELSGELSGDLSGEL